MNPKAIEAIEKKIVGVLKQCEIKDKWPVFETISTPLEALDNEVLKHKNKLLFKNDCFSIFYDLFRNFWLTVISTIDENKIGDGVFWDVIGEHLSKNFTKHILDYIISIPRQYDIYIPLPSLETSVLNQCVDIDEKFSWFIEADKKEVKRLLSGPIQFDKNKIHIKQIVNGYCNTSLKNRNISDALNNFKILTQYATSHLVFEFKEVEPTASALLSLNDDFSTPKYYITVVDCESGEELHIELPLHLCNHLQTIHFSDLIVNATASMPAEERFGKFFKRVTFLIESDLAEANNIKSSMIWAFEANMGVNETLSFIQVCIGLEAILGDRKSSPGLTKTLADRCSYLIAKKLSQRSDIKGNFGRLYDIRSQIVHGNVTSLSNEEIGYLDWGKNVLMITIRKEISLHLAND